MARKRKKSKGIGRGGARPGAGRPKKGDGLGGSIGLRVGADLHGWLQEQPRGAGSRLAREGLRIMRHLPAETMARLEDMAQERGVDVGELVANIISKCPLMAEQEVGV